MSLVPLVGFQGLRQFAEGLFKTRLAMYATLMGNVINVLLNYLLILEFTVFLSWASRVQRLELCSHVGQWFCLWQSMSRIKRDLKGSTVNFLG